MKEYGRRTNLGVKGMSRKHLITVQKNKLLLSLLKEGPNNIVTSKTFSNPQISCFWPCKTNRTFEY